MSWRGLITALPTPFRKGALDIDAFVKLLQYQYNNGVKAVCICGSTGESTGLKAEERREIITTTVQIMGDKLKIIVGVGSNDTSAAVQLTTMAKELGAHCAMAVMPYYNRPTTDGLLSHFSAIASVGLPVMLYNVPSRTALDVDDEVLFRLLGIDNVVGLKDATGRIARISNLLNIAMHTQNPNTTHVNIISGDDDTMVPARIAGASGLISVISNIIPTTCLQIQELCDNNDYAAAATLQQLIYPLIKAISCVTNPIPVKAALAIMGLSSDEMRLPLCATSASNVRNIRLAIKQCADSDLSLKSLQLF